MNKNLITIKICNMFGHYIDDNKLTNEEINILYEKINRNLIRIKEEKIKKGK